MSEKISTPSPVSTSLTSLRAAGSRSNGSSDAATDSVSNCGGRPPSTCVTALTRLSGSESWAMMSTPIMALRLQPEMVARSVPAGGDRSGPLDLREIDLAPREAFRRPQLLRVVVLVERGSCRRQDDPRLLRRREDVHVG